MQPWNKICLLGEQEYYVGGTSRLLEDQNYYVRGTHPVYVRNNTLASEEHISSTQGILILHRRNNSSHTRNKKVASWNKYHLYREQKYSVPGTNFMY
jgi:hypothetical protein